MWVLTGTRAQHGPITEPPTEPSERKSRDARRRNQRAGGGRSRRSDKNWLRVTNGEKDGGMEGQHEDRVKDGRSDGVSDKSFTRHVCCPPRAPAALSQTFGFLSISERPERVKPRGRGPPRDVITVKRASARGRPPSAQIKASVPLPASPQPRLLSGKGTRGAASCWPGGRWRSRTHVLRLRPQNTKADGRRRLTSNLQTSPVDA